MKIVLSDFGKIILKPNEQISFITENLATHDVTRKIGVLCYSIC